MANRQILCKSCCVRTGVTLLEVLAAMFVLTIGLLGMATLLPVGRFEVAEAQKLDRASTLGRAAFRDLQVRGFLRPEMWLNPVPGTSATNRERFVLQSPDSPLITGSNLPLINIYTPNNTVRPPLGPIVLDPLGVFPVNPAGQTVRGIGVVEGQEPNAGHLAAVSTFPFGLISFPLPKGTPEERAPKIARVTLREAPGMPSLMRRDTAERFFMSQDDEVYGVPERAGEKPVRLYQPVVVAPTPAANPQLVLPRFSTNRAVVGTESLGAGLRAQQGDYSWFVTISPKLTEFLSLDELQEFGGSPALAPLSQGQPGSPVRAQTGRGSALRQFLASVAVIYKRPFRDLAGSAYSDIGRDERMAWVDFTGGSGAQLRLTSVANLADAQSNLTVRANEWIALVGSYIHPSVKDAGGILPVTVLYWYRVQAVAEAIEERGGPGSGVYVRDIVLSGRSWADQEAGLLDADGDPKTGLTAIGIIIPRVVGVFEKTVTLDGNSPYTTSPY